MAPASSPELADCALLDFGKTHDFEPGVRIWRKRSAHKGDGLAGAIEEWLKRLAASRYELCSRKVGHQPVKTEREILIPLGRGSCRGSNSASTAR